MGGVRERRVGQHLAEGEALCSGGSALSFPSDCFSAAGLLVVDYRDMKDKATHTGRPDGDSRWGLPGLWVCGTGTQKYN